MQHRLPKYYRTEATHQTFSQRRISERDLNLIATIARYRIIPTSLLVRLTNGNDRITYEHLQVLYHRGLINRFHFPRVGPPGQFHYYLDHLAALDLLNRYGWDTSALDRAEIRYNREHGYCQVNDPRIPEESRPSLAALRHEMMISRFQALLELACRSTSGAVELVAFSRKVRHLKHAITAPKLRRIPTEDGDEVWEEFDETETLPHWPDAFFTLRFPDLPDSDQERHFFYEADRKTMTLPRFTKKLRAHHQFILRQKDQQHIERHYGVNRIRAVLIETIDSHWAEKLRLNAARSRMIAPKPSVLFWFTTSELFTRPAQTGATPRPQPSYLTHPEIIFDRIWATPVDNTLHSLLE